MLNLMIFTFIFSIWPINKYAPANTLGKPIYTKVDKGLESIPS